MLQTSLADDLRKNVALAQTYLASVSATSSQLHRQLTSASSAEEYQQVLNQYQQMSMYIRHSLDLMSYAIHSLKILSDQMETSGTTSSSMTDQSST